MIRFSFIHALAWAILAVLPAHAVIETYEFATPELQVRYQDLSEELRCPKCQNQNIADSNAPIAQDLRRLLYEQLQAGASDEEILDYMVARYGEFVRYRPSFDKATAALWLAPIILLLIGFMLLVMTVRRRGGAAESAPLSNAEQTQLRRLVDVAEKDV